MNKKSFLIILEAIRNAKNTVEHLGTENFPYTEFLDSDLEEIFFDLIKMEILIYEKIEKLKEEK